MTDQELEKLLEQTFWQHTERRIEQIKEVNRPFVHYTSTEAAVSIIRNKEIWLRNSRVMNDYSEIAHGEACVRYCLIDNHDIVERSKNVLNGLIDGLHDRAVHWFFENAARRLNYTYLLSISEHGPLEIGPGVIDEESIFGRLSMWRAYGTSGGVALVFNQEPLIEPKEVLPVFSSPVLYGNPDEFAHEYFKVLNEIEKKADSLKSIDPDCLWENLVRLLHFSILSCKHPGFREEREWRITYSADPANEELDDEAFNQNNLIKREFRSIGGLPQRIYKIPLIDFGPDSDSNISLPVILQRLIIGPTVYPSVVNDTFVIEMLKSGFTPEQIKIAISRIPLRT